MMLMRPLVPRSRLPTATNESRSTKRTVLIEAKLESDSAVDIL